jgi:hypothetical protein
MKYILIGLTLFSQMSCAQNTNDKKVDLGEALFKQYAFLLERSLRFDETNKEFKYEVQQFIDTCTEYNFHLEKRIKPFEGSKVNPIIVPPYLFNTNYNEAILAILTREDDLQNKPVDYIHFVLGEKKGGKWIFRLKERYTKSFSYESGHPVLSDTEIFLRMLRNLIDMDYMPHNALKINDDFFKKNW